MTDLYFIVEGETEAEFVRRILVPYFNNQGIHTNIQAVKITRKGGGHGFDNIEHLKNTIKPFLFKGNTPIITTMVDFFRMPTNIPGYWDCQNLPFVDQKIECLEASIMRAIQDIRVYPHFIPYIQKHEWEALLFSNPTAAFELEQEEIQQEVLKVSRSYPNPEDINSTPEGAPSKRLQAIYSGASQKYRKAASAVDLAELGGIEEMLTRCPRFSVWIHKLVSVMLAT